MKRVGIVVEREIKAVCTGESTAFVTVSAANRSRRLQLQNPCLHCIATFPLMTSHQGVILNINAIEINTQYLLRLLVDLLP